MLEGSAMRHTNAALTILMACWLAGALSGYLNEAGWLAFGVAMFSLPWLVIRRRPKQPPL